MCSRKNFDNIWEKAIKILLHHYINNIKSIELRVTEEDLKESIWNNYTQFNEKCRAYMDETVKRLDRHKVSACYILAILKSEPFIYKTKPADGILYIAMEQLALSVGLEILRGFLLSKKDRNNNDKPKDKLKEDISIFKGGFIYPSSSDIDHGAYRDNFAIELYYTRIEGTFNILSLSHSLYLLETYNRQQWKLQQK